jgi:glucosamine--fructose-6-phosphate aminotransferase (isomerizing)
VRSLGKFPDPFIAGIAEQPDALRRAAAGVAADAAQIRRVAERARRHRAVFVGMGSSYDACYPAVTYLARRGAWAPMLDAAELLHFRMPVLSWDDVVVLVSQSGESAETVAVARAIRARREPSLTVAVTNGTGSTLAGLADVVLDTRAGPEEGPSTATFVAALAVLAGIARAIGGADVGEPDPGAASAAAAIETLLADEALPDRLAAWHGGRAATVILGRGSDRAAAEMGALTVKEAVGIAVESLQTAQFRHGPLELAGRDLAAIVHATQEPTRELDLRLAAELVDLGAAVLVITADEPAPDGALGIALGPIDDLIAPAAGVVPSQLLAWRSATEAGRQPGAYVHASKVTTRE